MADPFAQYESGPAPASGAADPFAQYEAAPPASPAQGAGDPFAQYESQTPAPKPEETKAGPTGELSPQELDFVAKQYGVDKAQLAASAPFLGLKVQGQDGGLHDAFWNAAGFVDQSLSFGLARKYFIARQDKPEERAALQALADIGDKRKSGWRTAAELAGGVAGAVVGGGGLVAAAGKAGLIGEGAVKAAQLAAPAVGGAVAGYAHSHEGEELKDTLFGAGAGLVLQGAFAGMGAAGRAFGRWILPKAEGAAGAGASLPKQLVTQASDAFEAAAPGLEENFRAALGAFKQGGEDAEAALTQALPDLPDFTAWVSQGERLRGSPAAVVGKLAATVPEEELVNKYLQYQRVQHMADAAGRAMDELAEGGAREGKRSWGQTLVDSLRDGAFVGRDIDNRLGRTSVERTQMAMSKANGDFLRAQIPIFERIKEYESQIVKSGIDPEHLYAALEGKSVAGLTDEQREVVAAGKQFWSHLADVAEEHGLPLQRMESGYVRQQAVQLPEYIRRIVSRADGQGLDLANRLLTPEEFEQLAAKDGDLVTALGTFAPGRDISSPAELTAAYRAMLDPRQAASSYQKAYNLLASAVERRGGEVPEFVRDKDQIRLLASWTNNTLRAALFKPHIDQMMADRDIAVLAGDNRAARYLNNLVADVVGTRSGTVGAGTKNWIARMQTNLLVGADAARKAGQETRANFLEWAADKPNAIPTLMNQVYPNYLGWNPKAWVNNLTQPYLTTLPELGFAYGTPKVLFAQARALDSIRQAGGIGAYKAQLEAEGLLKPQMNPALYRALRGTMEKGVLGRAADKAMDWNVKAAMAPFELTEVANRAITRELGHMVAEDLLGKGSAKAAENARLFVRNAGGTLERDLGKLIAAGDEGAVKQHLSEYLAAKTMFSYDRATMSEYGRFMGPFWSVFTKWPLSIAGDVYQQYQQRGAARGTAEIARKYLAPWAALALIDSALPDPEDNRWVNLAFGKGGLRSAAPIGTVKGLVTGELFEPPAVQAVKGMLAIAASGKPVESLWQGLNNLAAGFVPGAVLGAAYTRAHDFTEGERSKGSFTQRLAPDHDIDARFQEIDENLRDRLSGMMDR